MSLDIAPVAAEIPGRRPDLPGDRRDGAWRGSGALLLASAPADATFHLMQIEQVIGGVNGDTLAQAIQLRMRLNGQGGVSRARLVVYDAAGMNPVVLIDFFSDVVPEMQGGRILITSPVFAAHTTPAAVPDFTLVKLIPESYLAAGSLTFESNLGLVLWRLSWGGDGYTGPNRGASSSDRNGDFGPPFDGPLPSTGTQARSSRTFKERASASRRDRVPERQRRASPRRELTGGQARVVAAVSRPDVVAHRLSVIGAPRRFRAQPRRPLATHAAAVAPALLLHFRTTTPSHGHDPSGRAAKSARAPRRG